MTETLKITARMIMFTCADEYFLFFDDLRRDFREDVLFCFFEGEERRGRFLLSIY